jgi:hypothetical protein
VALTMKRRRQAWKVSAMNISKQNGESEEMSFKRMISLLYEFACTNESAVEVSQNVAGNLIKREGIQRNLALFQAAVATRRLGFLLLLSLYFTFESSDSQQPKNA